MTSNFKKIKYKIFKISNDFVLNYLYKIYIIYIIGMLKKIGYQVYKLNFMNRRIFTTAYSDISFYNWNDPQTLI